MLLKIFILSVILIAFTMLALGVKLLFNREAKLTEHACSMGVDGLNNVVGACAGCEIKVLASCSENKN